ncbi:MAG: hypothetical protein IJF14_01990 [Clostridia bacterium]|nr:hypothetical protein [Clostridia bacterium]
MSKQKNNENQVQYMPIGMSIGVALGVAVGAFTHNIALCMCMGLSIGMAVGCGIDAKIRSAKEEKTKEENDGQIKEEEK